MNKDRYFDCKERGHTVYECPKKGKVAAVSERIDENCEN